MHRFKVAATNRKLFFIGYMVHSLMQAVDQKIVVKVYSGSFNNNIKYYFYYLYSLRLWHFKMTYI